MDLEKLNHPNKELYMNTYNRNVYLHKHVVLLTVMEHAEELILKKCIYIYINFLVLNPQHGPLQ